MKRMSDFAFGLALGFFILGIAFWYSDDDK
jgi:hypothetical protein